MKHAIRTALLAACILAAACGTVESLKALPANEEFQSSGSARLDNSLSTLAVSVNGNYQPDGSADAPSGQVLAEIQQFAGTFARRFPAEFPDTLKPYAVASSAPGRGVPLLRLYIASGRGSCDERRRSCVAEARIDGSLLDSSGKRAWWFSYWVDVDDPDERTYKAIYKRIVEAMAKDQVVTPD